MACLVCDVSGIPGIPGRHPHADNPRQAFLERQSQSQAGRQAFPGRHSQAGRQADRQAGRACLEVDINGKEVTRLGAEWNGFNHLGLKGRKSSSEVLHPVSESCSCKFVQRRLTPACI